MSDEELLRFLGLDQNGVDPSKARAYIAALSPQRRELFEKMRTIELWDNGFGPKPQFPVLLDYSPMSKERK